MNDQKNKEKKNANYLENKNMKNRNKETSSVKRYREILEINNIK